ncbi:MAG: aldo/keto reductase [Treponema sp.]|jgi:predicted aldo/keto reductase-like oxidoreductase|nr:aldo/keto reductase [Treponema sp.]
MQKVRFGKTELMVSKVALGGIPIMRLTTPEAAALVRETISLGINFIDTANGYADSEEKIGEAIKGIRREDLVIASKSIANDKKTFSEHIDLSLKRLGVDYIDIYQLHNVSTEEKRDAVFAPGGAKEALDDAVKAGKVRFPGFSSHSIPLAIQIMKSAEFFTVQLPFNFIDREAESEAIPLAKKLDMGFISMKPMGGGLLESAALSFRFLMSFDNIVPDPGIEKIEEIREIIDIVNKNQALSAADRSEIEKIKAELGSTWCHRCDYCLPCPQGIHISMALNLKSIFKRMTPQRARAFAGPPLEKARTCIFCGECKRRCPYNLDVPQLLKERLKEWDAIT